MAYRCTTTCYMKILFGIDSVFQFLFAANLRFTIYKDDEVDVIIYNSFKAALDIYRRIKDVHAFNYVYIASTNLTKCGKQYGFSEKLPKYFTYLATLVSPLKEIKKFIGEKDIKPYDLFLFNGYGALPDCIFNGIATVNPDVRCARIEDGFASYSTEFFKQKSMFRVALENIFHALFRTKDITNYIDKYYFADVELVSADIPYEIVEAPKFDRTNKELIETLSRVFGYDNSFDFSKIDLILFEDGKCYFDNNDEEVDIAKEVIKVLPKEKVIVKMHPRRSENRFKELGIDSLKASSVPWELIQLCNNFDGKIFMTVASSVVFFSDIYFGDSCYKILLAKCMKNPPKAVTDTFDDLIGRFIKKYGNNRLYIPNSYEELKEILKEIKKEQSL